MNGTDSRSCGLREPNTRRRSSLARAVLAPAVLAPAALARAVLPRAALALLAATSLAASGCEVRKTTADAGTTERRDAAEGAKASGPLAPATAPIAASSPATPVDASAPRQIGEHERPQSLAIDGTHVFWSTSWDLQGVRRAPRDGSAKPTTLCRLDARSLSGDRLVVTDTHVYVLMWGTGTESGLYRAPKNAENATCEKVVAMDIWRNRDIVAIKNRVYAVGASANGASVIAVDEDGKAKVLTELTNAVESLATDGTSLFVSDATTYALTKIDLGGGAGSGAIGTAGTNLHFAEGSLFFFGKDKAIFKVPITGGASTRVGGGNVYGDYVVIAGTIYTGWAPFSARIGGFTMRKIPVAGPASAPTFDHASFRDSFRAIAGDARDVFVATSAHVIRVAP